jgi:C4-dicarboxylate-specific signal transduction histidine kinase
MQCTINGFYTYGEFFSDKNDNYMMSESMTLLGLSESSTNDIDPVNRLLEEKDPRSPNIVAQALTYMINVVSKEWEERLNEEIAKNREIERIDFQNTKLIQMGELVSMIAHQWRQPLNALSAAAINMSLLSSMGKLELQQVQESSRFIQEQCQKMSQTIDTFINFVKPAKESQSFTLQHTIEAIMQIIGSQMSSHNIDITMQQLDETISIDGYEDLLEQVLLNLISNTKDAFDNQSIVERKLTITVTIKEGIPRIIMEDNAGGIPVDAREKIFNPYFTTKSPGKGTGIGLYMSINIMRKSFNGDLLYTPLPNGSRFELILGQQKKGK